MTPSQDYPERGDIARQEWRRKAMPIEELTRRMASRNKELAAAGHAALVLEEVIGGRLYTGPM